MSAKAPLATQPVTVMLDGPDQDKLLSIARKRLFVPERGELNARQRRHGLRAAIYTLISEAKL